MRKLLVLACALAVSPLAAQPAPTPAVNLTVRAEDFRNTQGIDLFALYNSKKTWLKKEKEFRRAAKAIVGSSAEVVFENLPPGEYALGLLHDENNNGDLDFKWFPPGPKGG